MKNGAQQSEAGAGAAPKPRWEGAPEARRTRLCLAWLRWTAFCLLLFGFCLSFGPRPVAAHPMGNFSISHYAGIRIERDHIELLYILDMAEIPTFQEIQQTHIVPKVGDASLTGYLAGKAEALKLGLAIELNGRRLPLLLVSQSVIFPPGAGGLPTMKVGFVYRAALERVDPDGALTLHYRDDNYQDRAGWKEVIAAAGQDVRLVSSSVPEKDRSQQLGNYPTDMLNSPPQVLEASVEFTALGLVASQLGSESSGTGSQATKTSAPETGIRGTASDGRNVGRLTRGSASRAEAAATGSPNSESNSQHPARGRISPAEPQLANPNFPHVASDSQAPGSQASLEANKQGTPRSRFTELIAQKQFGFWFLFTAALIAAGLGALHALEPGHGKTIVAAYLVGSHGTAKHACLLGLIVTASHTAGVYLLGVVTLYASHYVVPERLYPWLGVLSGLTIAGLGFYLFLQRYANGAKVHSHTHGHVHSHWPGHYHSHGAAEPHECVGEEIPDHGLARVGVVHLHTHEGNGDHVHGHQHPHAAHSHSHGAVAHSHNSDEEHVHLHAENAHGHEHAHATLSDVDVVGSRADGFSRSLSSDSRLPDSESAAQEKSATPTSRKVSYGELLALGVTGGMVPCPAALVVLLSAVALHRIGFGLFLIVAFSLGLAAVLIAIGILMVCAGRFMSRLRTEGPLITRWLPIASAAVITVLGLVIAVRALVSAGILQINI